MTNIQARDRDRPVDRERGAQTTVTIRVRDRRRPIAEVRRPLRIEHDMHLDLDATAGHGRLGEAY